MEDRASRFNQVPGLVIRMIQSIQNDLQAASNLMDVNAQERGSLALLLESYKSQYTIGNSAGKWQYQINSEWDTNNVKRDLDNAGLLDFRNLIRQRGDGDSCPLTAPASASLPAATGFETAGGSVRGGGGGGGATASQTGQGSTATPAPLSTAPPVASSTTHPNPQDPLPPHQHRHPVKTTTTAKTTNAPPAILSAPSPSASPASCASVRTPTDRSQHGRVRAKIRIRRPRRKRGRRR
ncbi:MAG: hypothetical protein Q9194_004651 [Teloschistes cf. exilis]